MSQGSRPTVLLVEADASLRRLIRLGLQERGMQVIEARALVDLQDLEWRQPDVLLLDIDHTGHSQWSDLESFQAAPQLAALPTVVLTWDSLLIEESDDELRCLAKPFDARLLYATIEQFLVNHQTVAQRQASELVLAAQSSTSLYPLLTAAGLLILMIGLMIHPLLAAGGLLMALITLLSWTLDSKPLPQLAS